MPAVTTASHVSTGSFLAMLRTIFGHKDLFERVAHDQNQPAAANLTIELLQKIDQGYVVEETGQLVRLPGFVRVQLKTRIETGDWC